MSDRDDDLARLFSHRVSPLAPPPGTFDRIVHTARRRRRARALLAVASSAVVFAAGAGAYAALSTGSVAGLGQHHFAGGLTPTPGGHRAASPAPSSAGPSAPPAPSAQQTSPPAGAAQWRTLPAGWAPQSVSFTDPEQGFAVGTSPGCSAAACQALAYTSDGGRSWRGLTFTGPRLVPVGSGGSAAGDVSQIRFSAGNGYAFGPGLWTSTGWWAQPWQRVDVGTVLDLAATSRTVFAVVTHCNPTVVAGCSTGRPGPVLVSAPVGLNLWSAVGGVDLGAASGPVTADLQIQGQSAYLLLTRYAAGTPAGVQGSAVTGTVLVGSPDGVRWHPLPAACSGTGPATLTLGGPADVLVGCPDGSVLASAGTAVAAWRPVGLLPGAPTALSAAPGGQALLALVGGRVLGSVDGGASWAAPGGLASLPTGTVSFLGYTTASQAVAVTAGAHAAVWMSRDAGRTWQPVNGARG